MRFWIGGPRILGMRTGVSFGREDFRPARQAAVEGGFVYIVENDLGACKVGISRDPLARLASLQTGSAHRLRLAHVAATRCTGFEIEQRAHQLLAARSLSGEWFDCGPAAARHAVQASAEGLARPLAWVDPGQIPQIIALANEPGAAAPRAPRWPYYLAALLAIGGMLWFIRASLPPGQDAAPAMIGIAIAGVLLLGVLQILFRLLGR